MTPTFQIAVVATAYYLRSHADVITTRWTTHRPGDPAWGWEGPSSKLASIYIEQMRTNDTGVAWAREHGIPQVATVEDALTLGQGKIAVDGVVLIGEHGDYPYNELHQKRYPRKELFDKIVEVFRKYGQSVPVFNDKHYSWNAQWSHEMVATAKELDFPLLGGSSIPHTPFIPPVKLSPGYKPRKAIALYYGDREAYLYHSYEFAQAVLEKRHGGESGIQSITAYLGDEAWNVLENRFGWPLLNAALGAAGEVEQGDVKANCAKAAKQPAPLVTLVKSADGLETAHVDLSGHFKGWNMAIETEDGQIHPIGSTAAGQDLWYAHFATFSKLIETFLKTGQYPFAPQRALFSTCATAASMHAAAQPGEPYECAEVAIAYQPHEKDVKYHPQA